MEVKGFMLYFQQRKNGEVVRGVWEGNRKKKKVENERGNTFFFFFWDLVCGWVQIELMV